MTHTRWRAARAAPQPFRRSPFQTAESAVASLRGQELIGFLNRQPAFRRLQRLDERKQVALAAGVAVGGVVVMWLLTTQRSVRGKISEDVAEMATQMLAAKPLQKRVIAVAGDIMIERLADPATVEAATSFTLRVLEQQRTEDASRGVAFGVLSSERAADQVTKLWTRVGSEDGTKDAVVTVFKNAYVDERALTMGTDYLRRVLTSVPVTGTVGGTLGFQFQEVLNASDTRHHTHELVASVLESESVQKHAADFVWASLTGAENKNRGHADTGTLPMGADTGMAAVVVVREKMSTADAAVGTGEDLLAEQDSRGVAAVARISALTERLEAAEVRVPEAGEKLAAREEQARAAGALMVRLAKAERVVALRQATPPANTAEAAEEPTVAAAPLRPWTLQYWRHQGGGAEAAPTQQQRVATGHGLGKLQQVVADTDRGSWGSVPMEAGPGDGAGDGAGVLRGARVAIPATGGTQD